MNVHVQARPEGCKGVCFEPEGGVWSAARTQSVRRGALGAQNDADISYTHMRAFTPDHSFPVSLPGSSQAGISGLKTVPGTPAGWSCRVAACTFTGGKYLSPTEASKS